jgi:hypothetical protein
MADFPSTLPAPLLAGYGGEPANAVIRTDFEAGPARQRRRFTATPHQLDVAWRFKPAEMIAFREFFKVDINLGVDWFNVDLDIGDGLASYVARFIGAYKYDRLSPNAWHVTAKLEVENA